MKIRREPVCQIPAFNAGSVIDMCGPARNFLPSSRERPGIPAISFNVYGPVYAIRGQNIHRNT